MFPADPERSKLPCCHGNCFSKLTNYCSKNATHICLYIAVQCNSCKLSSVNTKTGIMTQNLGSHFTQHRISSYQR